LTLGCATEQDRAHAGSHSGYHNRDRGADELHGIIDRHPGRDGTARGVDVEGDRLTRSIGFQIEQFLGDVFGGFVRDFSPEENFSLFEELVLDAGTAGFFFFLVVLAHEVYVLKLRLKMAVGKID